MSNHEMAQISIKIPAMLKTQLGDEAKKTGITKSELIRRAIENRKVVVLAEGATIAATLVELCQLMSKDDNVDEQIRKGVGNICRLLSSVIKKLEEEA